MSISGAPPHWRAAARGTSHAVSLNPLSRRTVSRLQIQQSSCLVNVSTAVQAVRLTALTTAASTHGAWQRLAAIVPENAQPGKAIVRTLAIEQRDCSSNCVPCCRRCMATRIKRSGAMHQEPHVTLPTPSQMDACRSAPSRPSASPSCSAAKIICINLLVTQPTESPSPAEVAKSEQHKTQGFSSTRQGFSSTEAIEATCRLVAIAERARGDLNNNST